MTLGFLCDATGQLSMFIGGLGRVSTRSPESKPGSSLVIAIVLSLQYRHSRHVVDAVPVKFPIILKKLGLCRAAAYTAATIKPIPKSKQGRDITRPT